MTAHNSSDMEYRLMSGMDIPKAQEAAINKDEDDLPWLTDEPEPKPGHTGMTVEEFKSKSGYKVSTGIKPAEKVPVDKSTLGDKSMMVMYLPIIRKKKIVKSIIKYMDGYAAWVCGGFARYVVSPRIKPAKTDDIDIYCESEAVYESLKAKLNADGFTQKYDNPVAVCFHPKKNYPRELFSKYMVNLIKPVVDGHIMTKGTPKEIIANFDFSVTRVALVSDKDAVVDSNFVQDESDMFLRIGNIHCPISSSLRVAKYYRKGYYTKPMEIVKLFRDWDGRGTEYKEKLLGMIDMLEKTRDFNPEEVGAILGSGKSKKEITNALYEMMRVD